MANMVLGVFDVRNNAEDAILKLEDLGHNPKDISIIMKDKGQASEIESKTGARVAGGAVSGAATGGIIGGLAGLLIGIGAITIPGLGAILIGGPLAGALGLGGAAATTVSGAVTGALAGGLVGALVGLGIPEDEAKIYEDRIKAGAILIAVPTTLGRQDEVRSILEDYGATQIKTLAGMTEQPMERESDRSYWDKRDEPYGYAGAKGGTVGKDENLDMDYEEGAIRRHRRLRRP